MPSCTRIVLLTSALVLSVTYVTAIVAPAVLAEACDGCVDDEQGSGCPVTCPCACRTPGRAIAFAQPHLRAPMPLVHVAVWQEPQTPPASESRELLDVPKTAVTT